MSFLKKWDHFISSYISSHSKDEEHGITLQQLTSIILDEYHHYIDMDGHEESHDKSFYAQSPAN